MLTDSMRAFLAAQDGRTRGADIIRALVFRFGLSPFQAGRAIADYAIERATSEPCPRI